MKISHTSIGYYITATAISIASLAHANTITVINTNDDGMGSLREAVSMANAGDTIRFSPMIDGQSINLISEIVLNKNLVIIGNGSINPSTSSSRTIIDGMDDSRIFNITDGDTVHISGVQLQGGNVVGNEFDDQGGAIYNEGVLQMSNSNILGNAAETGAGIYNEGVLRVFNTTFSNNNATISGGGIFNSGDADFLNSSFLSNTAIFRGGGVFNWGTADFTNISFKGNTANLTGGAVQSTGQNTVSQFFNSTFSGNHAKRGGGVSNSTIATSNFFNSTLTGNTATSEGGGVYNSSSTVSLINSVVALNSDNGSGPDIYMTRAALIDGGHNLIGDTTGVSDQFPLTTLKGGAGSSALDPLFVMDVPVNDSLGGDVRLSICSPAVNAGDNSGIPIDTFDIDMDMDSMETLPLDHAGKIRVFGGTIDIGAYETQVSNTEPLTVMNTSNDGPNSLRYLIDLTCDGDTIAFDESLNMDTIKLTSGEITIDKNLVIIGNGQSNTIIDGVANSRLFSIQSGDTIVIEGLTVQNGKEMGSDGGAIKNRGTLRMTNTTLSGNLVTSSDNLGGSRGGAIYNQGTLTLINTLLISNAATASGNIAVSRGGALYNGGILTLINTSLSGNSTAASGSSVVLSLGGSIYNSNTLTMVNSTVSGSVASITGSNASAQGGGLYNNGNMTLSNSVLTGNMASDPESSSFASGGGIYNSGNITLSNSILARNLASNAYADIENSGSATINDGGHNILGDTTGLAHLFPLTTFKGGSGEDAFNPLFVKDVDTMHLPNTSGDLRLRICSPAVNAGDNSEIPMDTFDIDMDQDLMEILPLDISGQIRVFGGTIDIGAYEAQASNTDPLTVMSTNDDGPMSLRYLVDLTCEGDTIAFDESLDMDTIKLTSGEITIDKNLIIVGNDLTKTIIDGQASSRIFGISQGDTVSIEALTIQNGKSMSYGGGILNQGKLTLNNISLLSNTAAANGGGVYNNQFGTVTILNSTISKNMADKGGGIYNSFESTTTVSNSSVDFNIATGNGGGFYNEVTAIANFNMSSFADNKAGDGGALFNNGGTTSFMNMNIAGTGDGDDTSGVLSITGPTTFTTTTVFSRD